MTELVATHRIARRPVALRRQLDAQALAVWVLAGGLVLYLAFEGGGYDLVVHSQVGVLVWWIVLVAAAAGVLPMRRLTRSAWATLGLFGAFVAWSALAFTWSQSSERSLQTLSLVVGYLGILLVAIGLHRDRGRALRHTIAAIATAVAIVAALALISRLLPGSFPAAGQTTTFLPGAEQRLGWPLNYWNALAALIALGLPLLLSLASSARTLAAQAAAAGAIPLLTLCAYLTFSRGGALAAAAGLVVFIVLAPQRAPKLMTGLTAAAGSAALIAGAVQRSAVEQGLTGHAARHQGETLLVAVILVCAGVALTQVGIGLAVRHGTPPRWMRVSPRRAVISAALALAAAIVVAVLSGAPAGLSHAWQDFKRPEATALNARNLARFGTASGNGRYDYWKVAVNATSGHPLRGSGPGTYQLLWLPRAPYQSYLVNAHSLYFETLAETGVVGLALLLGFFALVIGAGVRLVARTGAEERVRLAAVSAACVAFFISALVDWVWQVPVLPASFMLLAAAVLAPSGRSASAGALAPAARGALVVVALACLVAIAVPLATATAVRRSQAASATGNLALALSNARDAIRIEPGAASAQLQAALVLEQMRDFPGALAAARRASSEESANWAIWLVRSRLEAESGRPRASLADFRRARSLNPRSSLFAS